MRFPNFSVTSNIFHVTNRKLVYSFRGESIFSADKVNLKKVSKPFISHDMQEISMRRHIFPQIL